MEQAELTAQGAPMASDAPAAEELVRIENLSLEYKLEGSKQTTLALDDINMSFTKDDCVLVLGPSGCGKSTLLKIIAGLLEPTSGKVYFEGKEAHGIDPRRAVVFQQPVLYPWMTVAENVGFGLKIRKVPKEERRERVEAYLKEVGLEGFGESKAYELSGGMRQRAALARELVNDPHMILMDEPFGALDALTRVKMQDLTRDIWREDHKSVFMITHDVDEALMLGTKVFVMSARPGRVVRVIDAKFTYDAKDNVDEVRYSPEYLQLRKEILHLINEM